MKTQHAQSSALTSTLWEFDMCDAEDAGGREGRRPGPDGREGEGEGTSGLEEAELFQLLREMGYLHTAAARHSRVELPAS